MALAIGGFLLALATGGSHPAAARADTGSPAAEETASLPDKPIPVSPYSPAAGTTPANLSDIPELDAAQAPPFDPAGLGEITLVFTGDNLLGAGMPRLIDRHGETWPYGAVADVLRSANLTCGNLECPVTDHGVKTPGKSWESIKAGRNFVFKAPPEYSGRILAAAGFDFVSLANNHAMDYGPDGLADTLACLERAGIAMAGAGLNTAEAFKPVVITRRGVRTGFIARSKIVPAASRAGEDAPGLAWHGATYSTELAEAIAALRPRCDVLVVTFHWGYEGHRRHAAYQQELAHRCIDAGADLVIGHHPHCLQGIELYGGGVIAYSLGNFLFTGASPLIESAMLRVTAGRNGVRQVELMPCWVRGGRPEPGTDDKLLERIRGICSPCGTELVDNGDWLTVQPVQE